MDCFLSSATQRNSAQTADDDAADAARAPAAAHIMRQRPPQHKPGWVDKPGMLAKLRGITNIGTNGLVVLFTPQSAYFVRGTRKECRTVPEVFSKGLFMIARGNRYLPSAEDPAARGNMHGDSVCMRCFELKRSPLSGQSNLLSHAQKCWPPEELEA